MLGYEDHILNITYLSITFLCSFLSLGLTVTSIDRLNGFLIKVVELMWFEKVWLSC